MKNIRHLLFLGCTLLTASATMLNAMEEEPLEKNTVLLEDQPPIKPLFEEIPLPIPNPEEIPQDPERPDKFHYEPKRDYGRGIEYDDETVAILDIIKFGNNPSKAFELLADFSLKNRHDDLLDVPQLQQAMLLYKDAIDTGIESFKKCPVELRKAVHKAMGGVKGALKNMKQEMLDTIKARKAIIADYEKKRKAYEVLDKNSQKTEKENKAHATLISELEEKQRSYEHAVDELKTLEREYKKMNFSNLEQWVNKIQSIAYWNSGSGFFEQFWNLNWSGKALTFAGAPLACYGAYKLYNDYLAADAEQSLAEDIQDKVQDVKNNLELAKVVVKQKLQ